MLNAGDELVALCAQCRAPLTMADFGYNFCLNCHWQSLFDYAANEEGAELRLKLHGMPGAAEVRDSAGRSWRAFRGDGKTWCVLCGEVVERGWSQGGPGGPQTYICDAHVDLALRSA